MLPKDARYSPTHEWCKRDGNLVTIGITATGLASLGDLVFVELPELNEDVLHEVPFGEIEGTRDVRDLSSPIDGIVVEVNKRIAEEPDILQKDPYEKGWLIRLKTDSTPRLDNLLTATDYEELLKKKRGK